jgi:hypothetical protein
VPEYNASPDIDGIYNPRLIDLLMYGNIDDYNNNSSEGEYDIFKEIQSVSTSNPIQSMIDYTQSVSTSNPIQSMIDYTKSLFENIHNLFNNRNERNEMTFWDIIRYIMIMSHSKSYASNMKVNKENIQKAIGFLKNVFKHDLDINVEADTSSSDNKVMSFQMMIFPAFMIRTPACARAMPSSLPMVSQFSSSMTTSRKSKTKRGCCSLWILALPHSRI